MDVITNVAGAKHKGLKMTIKQPQFWVEWDKTGFFTQEDLPELARLMTAIERADLTDYSQPSNDWQFIKGNQWMCLNDYTGTYLYLPRGSNTLRITGNCQLCEWVGRTYDDEFHSNATHACDECITNEEEANRKAIEADEAYVRSLDK